MHTGADIKYQDRHVGRHTVPTQTGRQAHRVKSDRQADICTEQSQTDRQAHIAKLHREADKHYYIPDRQLADMRDQIRDWQADIQY